MKKNCHISFIFLAFLFAFKSLSFIVTPSKASITYFIGLNENEPTEKGEKENTKEKDIFEEGKLNDYSGILILNYLSQHFFIKHPEDNHFLPYFEICSPPPELA